MPFFRSVVWKFSNNPFLSCKKRKQVKVCAISMGLMVSIAFVSTTMRFSTTISARYPQSIFTSSKITATGFSVSTYRFLFLSVCKAGFVYVLKQAGADRFMHMKRFVEDDGYEVVVGQGGGFIGRR